MENVKRIKEQAKIKEAIAKRMALKNSTLGAYANAIYKFCESENIDAFDFPKIGLENIEEQTETFIISNVGKLSPKYLNIIYNAVKTWCFVQRMIKNRKLFREIKFDKSSRKMDAMTEQPLETKHIKKLMEICDAHEQILLGLYGMCGLRPSLLTQIKVENLDANDYKLENGKITFTSKNPFLYIPKGYKGNKAHTTFFVIIPSKITKLIEHCLNQEGNVQPKTKLLAKYATCSTSVYLKSKELLKQVGFKGRPYLLRSYGDRLLDKTIEDKDLKEFMFGHKGKISATYQFKALTQEDKQEYLKDYATTEKWVNEKIFGTRSQEEISKAETIKTFAENLGASKEDLEAVLKAFDQGKFSMERYQDEVKRLTNTALETKMKSQFEKMFLEMNEKHNNKTS